MQMANWSIIKLSPIYTNAFSFDNATFRCIFPSTLKPSLRESGYVCNRILFFARIGPLSTRTQWIRTQKPHIFETALQSGFFVIRRVWWILVDNWNPKFFKSATSQTRVQCYTTQNGNNNPAVLTSCEMLANRAETRQDTASVLDIATTTFKTVMDFQFFFLHWP